MGWIRGWRRRFGHPVDQLLGPDASKEVRSRHLLEQISNQLISNQSLTIREGATKAGQDLGYSVLELPFLGLDDPVVGSSTGTSCLAGTALSSNAPHGAWTRRTRNPEAMIQQLHAAGPGLGGLAPPESDPVGIAAFVVMWALGVARIRNDTCGCVGPLAIGSDWHGNPWWLAEDSTTWSLDRTGCSSSCSSTS